MYHTCPKLPNYRRFCDTDGTILGDGVQRTICAPCVVMEQLFTDSDYCGDCEARIVTSEPTPAPTPFAIIPETAAPLYTAPVATGAPVTSPPVTSPPITSPPVTTEPA